jgi:hypothetical protein
MLAAGAKQPFTFQLGGTATLAFGPFNGHNSAASSWMCHDHWRLGCWHSHHRQKP